VALQQVQAAIVGVHSALQWRCYKELKRFGQCCKRNNVMVNQARSWGTWHTQGEVLMIDWFEKYSAS
jgi:hypothetical protein